MRARPISRRLRLTRRTLLAIATTYSTPSASRKSKTSGLATPPSSRIEVDRDAAGAAPEPRAMVLDDEVGQPKARQVELLPPHGVLEPGERRLGRQGGTGERIALEQELVDRVLGQAGGVVAVGVA